MAQEYPDRLCFNPSRNLLNPKFESYKLGEYDDSSIHRIKLPRPIDLSLPTTDAHDHQNYNYEDIKAKSTWNHLWVSRSSQSNAGQIIWIEPASLKIWSIVFANDAAPHHPQICSLLTLPDLRQDHLQSHGEDRIELDYPTAFSLQPCHLTGLLKSQTLWFVLDGSRNLFLVDLEPSSPQLLAHREISGPEFVGGVYKLVAVESKSAQSHSFWVVLRAKLLRPPAPMPSEATEGEKTARETMARLNMVYLLQVDISPTSPSHSGPLPFTLELHLHTQLTGQYDLIYANYDQSRDRWCLGSTSTFNLAVPASEAAEEASDLPVGQVEGDRMAVDRESSSRDLIGPPYHWSQTESTLTIVFPIPHPVPSKAIKIIFRHNSIHVRLQTAELSSLTPIVEHYMSEIVKYFGQTASTLVDSALVLDLWSDIFPDVSVWFVECGRNESTLTIELEKKGQKRWPQVFCADDKVDATMDASELRMIAEQMNKYTGSEPPAKRRKQGLGLVELDQAAANAPDMLGNSNTTLSGGEMDVEIDMGEQSTKVGVVFTWLVPTRPGLASPVDGHPIWQTIAPQRSLPVEIISTALPLASSAASRSAIMIKSDVDGLVFEPPDDPTFEWRHTLSFPALAFVMASKRDIRFSFFVDRLAIVLESSSGLRQIGNMFVYQRDPRKHNLHAQQLVIRISDNQTAGSGLGVSGIVWPNGSISMVCLCESEVVICNEL